MSENRMVFRHEYPLSVSVALAMNSNPVAPNPPLSKKVGAGILFRLQVPQQSIT